MDMACTEDKCVERDGECKGVPIIGKVRKLKSEKVLNIWMQ